jgi:prepilin-type processing-associated H-X9-DG protein
MPNPTNDRIRWTLISTPTQSRKRRAFTQVELLVVFGIIGLLISILLPSMRKAQASAIRIACVSNLRQLAMGVNLYANNNRGLTPQLINFHRRPLNTELDSDAWMRDFGKDDWGGGGKLYQQKLIQAYKAFYCPAYIYMRYDFFDPEYYFPNGDPDKNNYYIIWSTYDFRNAWFDDGNLLNPRLGDGNGKISHMKNKIVCWDQVDLGKKACHKTGINVAYYDGHVGWYEDRKNVLKINIWDGGPTHIARVQTLVSAMER